MGVKTAPLPEAYLIAAQKLMEGVKEEMLAKMAGIIQTAAETCAEVCAHRLHEQHNLMVEAFQQVGEQNSSDDDNIPPIENHISYYQLEEPEKNDINTKQVGIINTQDIEALYEDLDHSVEDMRVLVEARRQEMMDVGILDSDDDALDRELLSARGPRQSIDYPGCVDSDDDSLDPETRELRKSGIFDDEEHVDKVLSESRRVSLAQLPAMDGIGDDDSESETSLVADPVSDPAGITRTHIGGAGAASSEIAPKSFA